MASGYPSYRAMPVQPPMGGIEDHDYNNMGNGVAERYAYEPQKTICGFRRRTFFIILGIVIVLVIAGLATGLGVALSSKNGTSSTSNQSNSGEQNNGGERIILEALKCMNGCDRDLYAHLGFSPLSNLGTSSITNPQTTSGGTSASSSAGSPGSQASSSTPSSTDSIPNQTPSPKSSETTSAPATTDGPNVANAFPLSTGIHSFSLGAPNTAGNIQLCAFLRAVLVASTVIFPTIAGNVQSDYTATYNLGGIPGGITATGTPSSSGTAPSTTVWYFGPVKYQYPIGALLGGNCALEANSAFTVSEDGEVILQA
ncbi:hypothetical protein AA313_de0207834 [Arthrobotrys entomopaga]|nr:hypothetical protein AA313_de0207834 [Arthrobotrys entomopaga]